MVFLQHGPVHLLHFILQLSVLLGNVFLVKIHLRLDTVFYLLFFVLQCPSDAVLRDVSCLAPVFASKVPSRMRKRECYSLTSTAPTITVYRNA